MALVCFSAGIAVAFLVNRFAVATAVFFSLLLIAYSALFKRMVLIGNAVVSLATAAAFFYGGLAVGEVRAAAFPAAFAFFMHFGREIIKDMEDLEGDRRCGAATMPVRWGMRPAQRLAAVMLVVTVILTVIPFLNGRYGLWYLLLVLPIDLLLCVIAAALQRPPTPPRLGRMSIALKAAMAWGLLAIYAGRW